MGRSSLPSALFIPWCGVSSLPFIRCAPLNLWMQLNWTLFWEFFGVNLGEHRQIVKFLVLCLQGPSATGHGYSTTNSRLEDVETKASYKPSLNRGQRWVFLLGDLTSFHVFIIVYYLLSCSIWKGDSLIMFWLFRCVVLCDGFYEWQTTKGTKNKQPYFIYAPQPEEVIQFVILFVCLACIGNMIFVA